jgi:mRNA-degrading endonuclease toxin of MazEF toxin-antitoxin module
MPSKGMRDLKAPAVKSRGASPPNRLGHKLIPGAVVSIDDKTIEMPTRKTRTMHPQRRVIVVQTAAANVDATLETVLIVPCSKSSKDGPWDFSVPDGENGFTADDIVALASLVQPMLKRDLAAGRYQGQISPASVAALQAALARVLAMVPAVTVQLPARDQAASMPVQEHGPRLTRPSKETEAP